MQGIEFEDEGNTSGISMGASQASTGKPSFMFRLLNKVGVTDKATGNLILLVVAMLLFSYAGYLYAGLLSKNIPSQQDTEQIAAHIKMMREAQSIK